MQFDYAISLSNEELNQWNPKVKINLRHPVQCEGECESRLCWSVQAAITSCRQCLKSKQYRNQQHIKLFKLILFKHHKERSIEKCLPSNINSLQCPKTISFSNTSYSFFRKKETWLGIFRISDTHERKCSGMKIVFLS